MNKKKKLINKLLELEKLWVEIDMLLDEISDEDKDYCMGSFAENYPFTLSFDEYPSEIFVWIDSLQKAYNKEELENGKKNRINKR